MSLASLTSIHSVTIEQRTTAKDAAAGVTRTWSTKSTKTCRVQPLSASKRAEFAKNEIQVSHTMYFDVDPSISNGDRIKFGSRYFEVRSNARNVDELNRLYVVYAQEVVV